MLFWAWVLPAIVVFLLGATIAASEPGSVVGYSAAVVLIALTWPLWVLLWIFLEVADA